MSTSQRTFDQVKSILGKLDRDIDAARERRLQQRLSPLGPSTQSAAFVAPTPAAVPTARLGPSAPAVPLQANDPGRSGYGRARPLRGDDRQAFPPVQSRP